MNQETVNFPTLSLHQFDERGEKHDFYINTFSDHIRRHHAHVLVPHRHDFYVMVIFTSGSGFHDIDFKRHSIEKGAIFFMQPGQLHHWEFSEDTEGFVVLHSRLFFENHVRGLSLEQFSFFQSKRNIPKLNISDTIFGNFPKLLDEFRSQKLFKHPKSAILLCELYIDFARLYSECYPNLLSNSTPYSVKFRELESVIDTFYKEQKGVEFYADKLNISSRHLNRICKQVADKTFTQILTERVMLEARHLLTSTQLTFTEIALQLGYQEYSYFSKVFKEYCGMNLRDFRNTGL